MLKFKDPTPEEIEQFEKTYVPSAVSSPVPVAEEPIMEEPSTASDFLKAAGQGATLGFGDELLAALRAGSEVALGKPEMSDLAELYRKYQKINEHSQFR